MVSRYLFRGRRRGARRSHESKNVYVDCYSVSEWLPIAVLLALAMVDAVWTLRHLSRGISEANPIMNWTLVTGGTPGFVAAKLGVSLAGCGFLLLHARFRLTRVLLPVALLVYGGVMVVHVLAEAV